MLANPVNKVLFRDLTAIEAFFVDGFQYHFEGFGVASPERNSMLVVPGPHPGFMLAFILADSGSFTQSIKAVSHNPYAHGVILVHQIPLQELIGDICMALKETLKIGEFDFRPVAKAAFTAYIQI